MAGYFTRHIFQELPRRITKCSPTKWWEHLAALNLEHMFFFAGSKGYPV